MSNEIGDNSNDDNDLEVASVLAGVIINDSCLKSSDHSGSNAFCSFDSSKVLEKSEPPQNNLLQLLASKGELAAIKKILFKNPNHPEFVDGSVLLPASRNNWLKVVKYLLKQGCPVDTRGDYDTTALHQACAMGHHHVVKELLQHNSDINLKCSNGNTPLHYAIHSKNIEILQMLLLKGANARICNHNGHSAVDLAFRISDRSVENIIQLYLLN